MPKPPPSMCYSSIPARALDQRQMRAVASTNGGARQLRPM
jgi:hypothetical protein